MKFLIFDAGPFISLSMSGLIYVLERLKKEFNGEFIITPEVKKEVIDRPLNNKRYELGGLRILDLFERGIIKNSNDFIKNNILEKETEKILNIANSSLKSDRAITLIQRGEASCLAFAKLCNCENAIVIDERTTRMLSENPENLKKMMESKLHTKLTININNLKEFKKLKFIRSPELLYIAYQKNLLNLKKEKNTLDAILYSVKYSGAAISPKEIEEIKKIAK